MPILSAIGAACSRAFGMFGGSTVSASYLVVAGGGAGAGYNGGGGGAGGLLSGTKVLDTGTSYVITIGAGGAAPASGTSSNGSNTTAFNLTAIGGGRGGTGGNATDQAPAVGGSGGGGGCNNSSTYSVGAAGTGGQGYGGGNAPSAGGNYPSCGGGGAGGNAPNVASNSASTAGAGGVGVASSISGTSTYYAGGGGGAIVTGTPGAGGNGGGGAGGFWATTPGTSGTQNTGGGGGGGGGNGVVGGGGGSGVVIISYAGTQRFGGGVVTSVGGNTIHTFTTSGTLSPISPITASYLIVAGGGGGAAGGGGGGGAGGLLSGSGLTIDPYSTYLVTVGAGGAQTSSTTAQRGNSGSNSSFSMVTTAAVGGGSGGANDVTNDWNGGSGGSGGGGGSAGSIGSGGTGTSGQGNNGGTGATDFASWRVGGGGGGAGAAGSNGAANVGGNGGAGSASSISGTSTYYAGGGGGGGGGGGTKGTGGTGGGGNGGQGSGVSGTAGTANTGGGGGGAGYPGNGGAGGSGVVIISYPGSTQLMAGGTVTIVGGNVIHTFTSTGYLAPIKYLSNSLRFRSSASAYLNRTQAVPTTTTSWTWSSWVKRGSSFGSAGFLLGGGTVASNDAGIYFETDNTLIVSKRSGFTIGTTQVFRDPAAWYHLCVAYDSTQSTSSNRLKVYVNGVQVTALNYSTYPTSSETSSLNASAITQYIGRRSDGYYFDGYMAETNFVDGLQLTPNSFGTFNSYGVWQPITYGGSYGRNGFYLPFTNTSSTTTLGYDFSGNSNNWTTNNISLTAGSTYDSMTDVPTLTSATAANYAVLNPLDGNGTVVDANLRFTGFAGDYGGRRVSMAIPSTGKWYWETTVTTQNTSIGEWFIVGMVTSTVNLAAYTGLTANAIMYGDRNDGREMSNETTRITNSSTIDFSTGAVLQCAYDADTGKFWFGRNNSWWDSSAGLTGNPSAGTNWTLTAAAKQWFPYIQFNNANNVGDINFGQRPLTYTPPTGFVALNAYNM